MLYPKMTLTRLDLSLIIKIRLLFSYKHTILNFFLSKLTLSEGGGGVSFFKRFALGSFGINFWSTKVKNFFKKNNLKKTGNICATVQISQTLSTLFVIMQFFCSLHHFIYFILNLT